jgi:asparagine synthase (glutamine-hydrolysing)
MCGHISIYSKQDPISIESLTRGMSQLQHRGPDSQNHWVGAQGKVALGHTRLSIIDLSTGDQPLSTSDEKIHAVVNGEFYDYEKQRNELIQRGHHFKTQSDSEILLHLYRERGTACLEQLRGEFAFTLWDDANQILFAGRDRFGIKPLFYSWYRDQLYLASEIKALFAAGVPAHWDEEAVYHLHHSLIFHPGRTLYQNIFQIPPGHFLLASRNSFQIQKYWDFSYPKNQTGSTTSISEPDAIEETRKTLHEAVRLRLRADVPVGCYLSGGLDSCAVLGIASQYASQPIQAFTLSFDQPEYDEEAIAREMAAHSGANYTPIAVQPSQLADSFTEALWHAETPFMNTHGIAKFLLSKAVRAAGHKVVLTGEGSDEIFAGYPHFRRDFLLYQMQISNPDHLGNLLAELNKKNAVSQGLLLPTGTETNTNTLHQTLGFTPSFIETFSRLGFANQELLNPTFKQKYHEQDPIRIFLNQMDVPGQLLGREPVHQSLYLWSKIQLPNYILSVLGDRMEMGHSVEGRVPFLDHKLVETVVQMPVHMKIRGMTEKYVLREAAKPVLTKTVYERQKHPFLAPPVATQVQGPLFELMQDTLRGSQFQKLPFYASQQVTQLLDRLGDMDLTVRSTLDPMLMTLLSMTLLQERFQITA